MNTRIIYTIMAAFLMPFLASAQSASSDIVTTSGFTYPQNIEYVNYTDTGLVTMTMSNSIAVASFTLRDGGATMNDGDTYPTILNRLRFRVTNPSFIYKVGIEMNGSIVYQDYTNYKTYFTDTFGFENMTLTAPDNGSKEFKLRIMYSKDVFDNFRNVFTVIQATTEGTSSTFAAVNAGGAATSTSGDDNRIEVVATRLTFSTEPSLTAYLTTDLTVPPIVTAQDNNGRSDLDFTGTININNSLGLAQSNASGTAVFGQVFFEHLQFHQKGNIFLTASTPAGLASGNSRSFSVINSPQKRWDGEAGTSNWFDSLNWRPNGVPDALDYVLLDNNHITGTYTINMDQNKKQTIKLLKIVPKAGNEVHLVIPGSNTMDTALYVQGFSGMGDSASVTIHSKGFVSNASGTTNESAQPFAIGLGKFKLLDGGQYEHFTVAGHTSLVEHLSTIAGTEDGRIRFDVPGTSAYSLFADNASYGTLILNRTSGAGDYLTTSTSNPMTIRGDLQIVTPAVFKPSVNTLKIAGDLFNSGKFQPSTTTNVVLNGADYQAIAGNGTFEISKLELNNTSTAGVELMRAIIIENVSGSVVTFTNGKLHTTSTNLLQLGSSTVTAGGSTASFIDGPVQKTFTSTASLNIPIGKDTFYRPVTIEPVSASSTDFFMEYKRDNPTSAGYDTSRTDNVIKRVSGVEYWNISRSTSGTPADAYISLGWTASSGISPGYENQIRVGYWNGYQWEDRGGSSVGNNSFGAVQSNPEIASFGVFTLASLTRLNPLPVELISFNGKWNNGSVDLDWKTVSEINNKGFHVERSMDGNNWMEIGFVNGNGDHQGELSYAYTDNTLPYSGQKVAYYRLKQEDYNGASEYSNIISVRLQVSEFAVNKAYVNASDKKIYVDMMAEQNGLMNFSLIDVSGRVIYSGAIKVSTGQNKIGLDVPELNEGIHILRIEGNGNSFSEKLYSAR